MCYNKKCSEKAALSGHVIQLSIKTLTSRFGTWMFPITTACQNISGKMRQSFYCKPPYLGKRTGNRTAIRVQNRTCRRPLRGRVYNCVLPSDLQCGPMAAMARVTQINAFEEIFIFFNLRSIFGLMQKHNLGLFGCSALQFCSCIGWNSTR
jgi:hypothetical protein